MPIYSFYKADTGLFSGRLFEGPETMLVLNTPLGHVALEGVYDALAQRFDLATKTVVEWKPQQPTSTALETFVWDSQSRRWLGRPTATALAQSVRAERASRLAASDWTQLADADLTADEKAAWKAYRKALRDVTEQPGFPDAIVWPVSP
jgi:hypothetical protein